jgi:hypothetical protein
MKTSQPTVVDTNRQRAADRPQCFAATALVPFDIDSAPDAEPSPAEAETLAEFNRELQRAINAEFGSQPF